MITDLLPAGGTPNLLSLGALLARTFSLIIMLPTGDGLQSLPRLFISLCFAMALLPLVALPSDISFVILVHEFIVGLLIAAPLKFLVESCEMFGEVIDTARGQTIGSVVDPLNGQQGSDMATIIRLAMLVLAINIGAFDRAIEALVASYQMVPVGGLDLSSLNQGYQGALEVLLRQAISIATLSLSFSTSWLAAYLVIDIATGLLAKVVQGVQFTSTATVLKMVATCVLFINLAVNPRELIDLVRDISGAVAIREAVDHELLREPKR